PMALRLLPPNLFALRSQVFSAACQSTNVEPFALCQSRNFRNSALRSTLCSQAILWLVSFGSKFSGIRQARFFAFGSAGFGFSDLTRSADSEFELAGISPTGEIQRGISFSVSVSVSVSVSGGVTVTLHACF